MTADYSQLLGVRQASSRLGISIFTLRAWLRQGRLPYVQLGRRVLIRPQDLERFVIDHLVSSTAQRRTWD